MKKAMLTAAMLLAASSAHAELVGAHTQAISDTAAIIVQLSDTAGSREKCAVDGMYRVLVSVTDVAMFPRAEPYGDGCWRLTEQGEVFLVGQAFEDKTPIFLTFDARLFKVDGRPVNWARFAVKKQR